MTRPECEYRYSGEGVIHHARPDGAVVELARAANAWPFTWGHVVANLAAGRLEYAPAFVYVEFRNSADPDDPVPVPAAPRSEGVDYYLNLAATADRDYLRLPLGLVVPGRDSRIDGFAHLPADHHNVLTCQAAAAPGVGAGGKPFSFASGSRIYGSAVVAAPRPEDRSRDVVWSRAYYPVDQQFVMPPTGGLIITHPLAFR